MQPTYVVRPSHPVITIYYPKKLRRRGSLQPRHGLTHAKYKPRTG